jgi:hypothetical protein
MPGTKASEDITDENMNLPLLEERLFQAKDYKELTDIIVNEPISQKVPTATMFLGFIVLLIVNHKTGKLDRVSISDTELARNTFEVTMVPFEDIKIPMDDPNNIYVRSIKNSEPMDTTDWYFTFTPVLTGEQARINQASAGIAYTVVRPLEFKNGGALSFSYYQYSGHIGEKQQAFMDQYTKIVSRALAKFFAG